MTIGSGSGGEEVVTPYLLARYFGSRAFSTHYEWLWAFYAISGALGSAIPESVFN